MVPGAMEVSPSAIDEEMKPGASGFHQRSDYRHVRINGAEFSLTRTQAKVVKLLHEGHLREPWQFGQKILGEAGAGSMRMVHVFRSHKEPHWSRLIESDRRGYYRLNIAD